MLNMSGLKPPAQLSLQGNICQNYKDWIRSFEIYSIAGGTSEKSELVQCNTFLHVAGPSAQKVFSTFKFDVGDVDKIKPLKDKFKNFCEGKKNITVIRYKFNKTDQKADTFDAYVTDLESKITDCEFKDLEDSLLVDRIVCGVREEAVREKLLQTEDLTLAKTKSICRLSEITATDLQECASVNYVQKKPYQKRFGAKKYSEKKFTKPKGKGQCGQCGGPHGKHDACPAKGKECHFCHNLNHYQSQCRVKKRQKQVQSVVEAQGESEDSECELFIGEITVDSCHKSAWTEKIFIGDSVIEFKLDTGSEADIIPLKDFQQITGAKLAPSKLKLVSYSGHKVIPEGQTIAVVKGHSIKFQVVKNVDAILGRDSCELLGYLKRINTVLASSRLANNDKRDLLSEYSDVFKGLGLIESAKNQHLEVDKTVTPTVDPPRRIPHALREQVKNELDKMEKAGVIMKQTEPTPWVNSMVVVRSPGKVRVCLDPSRLNKAIKRAHYPVKTVEEVAASMPSAVLISTLDAAKGYWTISLDEESSKLCTFNSPWGRWSYRRLPFGISTSGDIFNRVMSEAFADIKGVQVVVDDILIHAPTTAEHDQRLRAVLNRAREMGIKFNPDKSKIGMTEVSYVGHVISKDGLKPSPERIRAVANMPTPTCKADVQRFVAFLGYLQKFIPNLSSETKDLRIVMSEGVEWHWDEPQETAFQRLKQLVSSSPVLKLYDVQKPVVIQTDASKSGLAAVLIQDDQPVAYASKALDTTQSNYAVIEKELLGICFGCAKYKDYIVGKKVTIETDHKPLVSIMTKPLHTLSARIQRMRMRLQNYDLKVTWRPGKELLLADTLSRAYLPETGPPDLFDDTLEVNFIQTSEEKRSEIQNSTVQDMELQVLKKVILDGWPEVRSKAPDLAKPYFSCRDELVVTEGMICKGNRIIIPKAMRSEMLSKIHEGHMGIVKSKQMARELLFWPGMGAAIEDMIAKCGVCQRHRNQQSAEPMIPHDIPNRPYAKVGTDLFKLNNKDYIITVDYYSKYPDINLLPDQTSYSAIAALKATFARYGIPDTVVSDNGPCYASAEFKDFASKWSFKHITSSPHFPQSNGQAERAIQTVKMLLKKAVEGGQDPSIALLNYRNTPIDGVDKSPAQLLMSRRLQTRLPSLRKLLKPEMNTNVHKKLVERQANQKKYYDTRALPTEKCITDGDVVRFKSPQGQWKLGQVTGSASTPRSLNVKDTSGKVYRRTSQHMFRSKEDYAISVPVSDIPQSVSLDKPTPEISMPNMDIPYTPPNSGVTPRYHAVHMSPNKDPPSTPKPIKTRTFTARKVIPRSPIPRSPIEMPIITGVSRAGRVLKKVVKMNL